MIIYKCKECNNLETTQISSLGYHIKMTHKIETKEYYDKYEKKPNEGICQCGKPTKFIGLGKGYQQFCCAKCLIKYSLHGKTAAEHRKKTNIERYGGISPMASKEVALKVASQIDYTEVAKKSKITKEQRYGKDFDKILARKRADNMEKTIGIRSTMCLPEVKQKALDTKEKRYGDRYYNNLEKQQQTLLKKYGNTNIFATDFFKEHYKSGREIQIEESIEHWKEALQKEDCEFISILSNASLKFRCLKCNKEYEEYGKYVKERLINKSTPCPNCLPKNCPSSLEEKDLCNWIKTLGFKVEENYKIADTRKEIDIFLPDLKIGIEYDGIVWHSELYKPKHNAHLNKTELCEANGIKLIHIFSDEWLNKKDIVKSRIKSILGISNRIYARKCTVNTIAYNIAAEFLEENHIQGKTASKYNYGLFYNSELVAVMTFGKSRFGEDVYELIRFANKKDYSVIGGAGKLLKQFIIDHNDINSLISYADRRWSIGNLYEKLGFELIGKTAPGYSWVHNTGKIRISRYSTMKHKLVKQNEDKNLSEIEIMHNKKFYRIFDCGMLKYKLDIT